MITLQLPSDRIKSLLSAEAMYCDEKLGNAILMWRLLDLVPTSGSVSRDELDILSDSLLSFVDGLMLYRELLACEISHVKWYSLDLKHDITNTAELLLEQEKCIINRIRDII